MDHLALLLPPDLPHRGSLIAGAAKHLEMIVDVNRYMNLTRIVDPREAVIKHILDSVIPWPLFTGAKHVLDAGTGAGFPGIPLAIIFPEAHFILSESTQKKARFAQSVVEALGLTNVEVLPDRAENILRSRTVDLIAARALAPLDRALSFLGPAIRAVARALFYKGPNPEPEIAEACGHSVQLKIVMHYELPDALGSRTIVEAVPVDVTVQPGRRPVVSTFPGRH